MIVHSHSSDNLQVDFLNIGDLSYTKPTGYSYKSKSAVYTKWKQIYVGLLTDLCVEFFDRFQAIVDDSSSSIDSPLVYSARRAEYFHSPMDIGNGLFVETNRSSTMLVNNIKRFLDLCGVTYGDVTITYTKQHSMVSTQLGTDYTKELLDVAETIISTCPLVQVLHVRRLLKC